MEKPHVLIGWRTYAAGVPQKNGTSLDGMSDVVTNGSDGAGFVWLRVVEPAEKEFLEVAARFNLPELAVEDAVQAHQRPKLEQYGDISFLVLKPATFDPSAEEITLGELHVFTGPDFCVTVRHGDLGDLDAVESRLRTDPDLMSLGPGAITYAVSDAIVDAYEPVIDGLEASIEDIERAVFDVSQRPPTERIYGLVGEVLDFRQATASLLGPLERLARGESAASGANLGHFFGDVADHARAAFERTDSFVQLLNGALQANLSLIGLQENRDQRKISAWAAVALVPTIIGGIWGMNVGVPLEGSLVGFVLVMLLTTFASGWVYWRLRRNGWL